MSSSEAMKEFEIIANTVVHNGGCKDECSPSHDKDKEMLIDAAARLADRREAEGVVRFGGELRHRTVGGKRFWMAPPADEEYGYMVPLENLDAALASYQAKLEEPGV